MELKGKKCLVTGADGFIGSHLVEALQDEGAEVRAVIPTVYNLAEGLKETISWFAIPDNRKGYKAGIYNV